MKRGTCVTKDILTLNFGEGEKVCNLSFGKNTKFQYVVYDEFVQIEKSHISFTIPSDLFIKSFNLIEGV